MQTKMLVYIILLLLPFKIYAKDILNFLLNESESSPYANDTSVFSKIVFDANVFGQLLDVKNNTVVPKLLKSAFYDYEQKEYILVLNDNIYFHNKRKANIYDLEFSLIRLYLSSKKDINKNYLDNIEGISELRKNNITKFKTGLVKGIKIINKNTLSIKLSTTDPDFLFILAEPLYSLVPIEEMDSNYIDWKSIPIGAGNYAVDKKGYSDGLVKLFNENLNNLQLPKIVNLYTKKYPNIDYDISFPRPDESVMSYFEKYKFNSNQKNISIVFTNNNILAKDLQFRKFIQSIIDVEKIYKKINSKIMSDEFIRIYKYGVLNWDAFFDKILAEKYLNNVQRDNLLKEWKIAVYNDKPEVYHDIQIIFAEIKRQLAEYNIKVTLKTYNTQILPRELAEQSIFDISPFSVSPYEEIYNYMRFTSDWDDEYLRPNNDVVVNNLYDKAFKAVSRSERYAYIHQLSNHLHAQAYFIPIVDKNIFFYVKKDLIKNTNILAEQYILKLEELNFK